MPAKRRDSDERSGSDDAEGEALILHRLSSDRLGRPYIASIPTDGAEGGSAYSRKAEDAVPAGTDGYGTDDDDDEVGDLERGFAPRKRPSSAGGGESGKVTASQLADRLEYASAGLSRKQAVEEEDDKLGRPTWLRRTSRVARRSPRARICLACLAVFFAVAVFSIVFAPGLRTTRERIKGYVKGLQFNGNASVQGENWYLGYPGPTQTGQAPGWATGASLPAGVTAATPTRGSSPIQTAVAGFESKIFKPFEHMGPLTPYRSSYGHGVDDTVHRDISSLEGGTCKLEQVHILHRHGSRYPTTGSPAELVRKFLDQSPRPTFTGPLSFINSYKYRLGSELLTPVGRQQLYDSGVHAAIEYGSLAEADLSDNGSRLFVRAGSQRRIVDSALSWMQGFFGTYEWRNHTELQVQIEAPSFNSTLASNFACPTYGQPWTMPGRNMTLNFIDKYLASAKQRLSRHVQGSKVPFNERLLNAMQQLCSYDTVAFGQSDFCSLFTQQEWEDYEYAWDLQFFGFDGAGSPVGRAQGLGWVNEFIARLTDRPWDPSTQTSENSTLDSSKEKFPLGRRIYADFTHDSMIIAALSAFELPQLNEELKQTSSRRFKTTQLVPFAARFVVERLACADGKRYVRFVLNDAVLPLTHLKECAPRADGMCLLESFLQSQRDRFARAHWDNCIRKP
ncbi:phosphoglycerate mutase-like protein [Tilletiaria anomala UBC 951]|uniref:Phosphoglycerate mutase-like protein n=1 Tax=Tilletiaria anomala (strain ATCC 24038 / CBS 436.72 / UBC 951) TaxID=1037660 RepID=A0A066WGU7_TILAU|nr:phosphoglycerate mutase-like protein [Tilletiaria anomala UBC 951]KDN53031.1 phosphoglycerate mutase-like protein [Tilletiaria anomala UBC 951]